MTALNPLLLAQGKLDVAQGFLTVYAQLAVKNSRMTGYVKPMFSNLKVYDYEKEKNKGLLQQAKEVIVGAAAHIFKNRKRKRWRPRWSLTGP